MENIKLPLTIWFLAMHLLTQAKNSVAAPGLMRHLGVCCRTAWLIKHELLEVMRQREEGRQLTGRIGMDDAYLGGEQHGDNPGRGSENKVSFVAVVQTTESGQAQLACASKRVFTKDSLGEFMATSVVLPATVVSDGLNRFTVAKDMEVKLVVHARVMPERRGHQVRAVLHRRQLVGLRDLSTGAQVNFVRSDPPLLWRRCDGVALAALLLVAASLPLADLSLATLAGLAAAVLSVPMLVGARPIARTLLARAGESALDTAAQQADGRPAVRRVKQALGPRERALRQVGSAACARVANALGCHPNEEGVGFLCESGLQPLEAGLVESGGTAYYACYFPKRESPKWSDDFSGLFTWNHPHS